MLSKLEATDRSNMRSHKGITRTLILGIVLLLVGACNEADGPDSMTNPHFPQMREDPNVIMEALLEGELVLENGCIRAKSKGGAVTSRQVV